MINNLVLQAVRLVHPSDLRPESVTTRYGRSGEGAGDCMGGKGLMDQ